MFNWVEISYSGRIVEDKFLKGTHMTFTSAQFETAIENWVEKEEEAETFDDWGSFGERVMANETFNLEGIGTIKYVTDDRHNDDIWVVFEVDEQLYKLSGYYSSYSADEWEDDRIIPVKAEEKTIIIYTAI